MKKNVVIRDSAGRIRGRFESLNCTNDSLRNVCGDYGPDQYRVSWSERKLVSGKNGKSKRKAIVVSKYIRIYEPDGSVTPHLIRTDRGPVVIQDKRGDLNAFGSFMAEMRSGIESINARLDDIESDDDDDDDDDEQPPAPIAEPQLLEQILTFMRQPKYQPLMDALLIGDESQQPQRVDAVFLQNPTLPREIVLDLMQMIVSMGNAA